MMDALPSHPSFYFMQCTNSHSNWTDDKLQFGRNLMSRRFGNSIQYCTGTVSEVTHKFKQKDEEESFSKARRQREKTP